MPVDPTQQVPTAVPPQQQLPVNPDQLFTLEQVNAAREAARKEANDRLYGRLENQDARNKEQDERYQALMKEVEGLRTVNQQAAEAEAKRQEELAAQHKAAELAEMSAKEQIAEAQREWEERFNKLQQENEVKDALLQKERELGELRAYRDQRVRDEQDPRTDPTTGQIIHDGIAPQFVGYITGNSREEIDQAIITAQQNTTSILVSIREAQAARAANAPGVSVAAGMAPQVPQTPGTREYTAAEIAAMPLDSPELLALRQQHGIGRATPQHGMFG